MPSTLINISIINASTVLSDAEIRPVVDTLQKQVSNDFRPAWGIDAKLNFVPGTATPPPGAWWLAILDDSDQAGALARISRSHLRGLASGEGLCGD